MIIIKQMEFVGHDVSKMYLTITVLSAIFS